MNQDSCLPRRKPQVLYLCLLAAMVGCSTEPFSYVHIQGDLKFEDGTSIPAEGWQLIFYPQVSAIDDQTHPKQGRAIVAVDGSYSEVTSHKYNDGVIRGEHKVVIKPSFGNEQLIPSEYQDFSSTPLLLNTQKAETFALRVRKP